MTVKRYDPCVDIYGDGTVEVSLSGEYVAYEDYAALQAQVNALAAQRKDLIQEMEMAANDIAYAVYNLADMKMSDLKPGIIESTGPAETALIAERNLRQFAAQLRNGEQGGE